jgi:putative transposase
MLRSHAGAARVGFNWGLAHVKAVLGQREAEATYGISTQDLTPAVSWSLYCLGKEWNAAKGEVAPWWGQCSREAFNTGLDGGDGSNCMRTPAPWSAKSRWALRG